MKRCLHLCVGLFLSQSVSAGYLLESQHRPAIPQHLYVWANPQQIQTWMQIYREQGQFPLDLLQNDPNFAPHIVGKNPELRHAHGIQAWSHPVTGMMATPTETLSGATSYIHDINGTVIPQGDTSYAPAHVYGNRLLRITLNLSRAKGAYVGSFSTETHLLFPLHKIFFMKTGLEKELRNGANVIYHEYRRGYERPLLKEWVILQSDIIESVTADLGVLRPVLAPYLQKIDNAIRSHSEEPVFTPEESHCYFNGYYTNTSIIPFVIDTFQNVHKIQKYVLPALTQYR